MNAKERGELAAQNFLKGYNCAQSVAMAFADLTPLSCDEIRRAAHAFGGGFGRTRGLCGALAACGMIVGFVLPETGDIQADKTRLYEQVQQFYSQFEHAFGTALCGELLQNAQSVTGGFAPQKRDEQYYADRPCLKIVRRTAELFQEYLESLR